MQMHYCNETLGGSELNYHENIMVQKKASFPFFTCLFALFGLDSAIKILWVCETRTVIYPN